MKAAAPRRVRWTLLALLAAIAGGAIYLVIKAHIQTHAHPDVALAQLADDAHVVARYDDCSDYSGVGYVKNNSCIDYLLIQTPHEESEVTLLHDEVSLLDRHNWHLFSPRDFGYRAPVVGRTDLTGHDCLLLGPPATIPFRMTRRGATQQARSFAALTRRYDAARRHPGPIIGLQFYVGPANDPYHRTC